MGNAPMKRTQQLRIARPDRSWVALNGYGDTSLPGLMIVPGVMSDAAGWQRVASNLSAWPSVWVLNRRGRTPSGPLGHQYSIAIEVDDLRAALDAVGEQTSLFGWSYGAFIALTLAQIDPLRQVIAYEPVDSSFGLPALPSLRAAEIAGDWDSAVTTVNTLVSGFSDEYVHSLRADGKMWSTLRELSKPVYRELSALAATDPSLPLGSQAERIDLIIGAESVGTHPYGTAFQEIQSRLGSHTVTELEGAGHLAHLDSPAALSRLLDSLAEPQPQTGVMLAARG